MSAETPIVESVDGMRHYHRIQKLPDQHERERERDRQRNFPPLPGSAGGKHVPNFRMELAMLRSKLRGLEHYAERNGVRQIAELSEVEEARILQYRCETLESAIMEHGINIADAGFMDSLMHHSANDSSAEYGPWLAQNMREHDTMIRSARIGDYAGQRQLRFSSFKCSNEACIYYVYGFATSDSRDQHIREHHMTPVKRDSALSLSTPTLPFPDYGPPSSRPVSDSSQPIPHKLPGKLQGGPQLPPLNIGSSSVFEPRQGSATSAHPPQNEAGPLRRGLDDEAAADLAALRNSRSTSAPGTAEASSEVKYMQDIGPCLRCKLTNKTCDLADPCTSCTNLDSHSEEDYWRSIGCLRVNSSFGCLADKMLPEWLSSRQPYMMNATERDQSQALSDFLEQMYRAPSPIIDNVLPGLDWKDSFWLTDTANLPTMAASAPPTMRAPQIFTMLLNSQNARAGSYNFLDVLRCSQSLSASRADEHHSLPVLYNAKLLLRQTLFYDLLQQTPVIVPVDRPAKSAAPSVPDIIDTERYFRLLYDAMVDFFSSFQQMTMFKGPLSARDWFAGFFSICLFSIVKHILVERVAAAMKTSSAWQPRPPSRHVAEIQTIDDIYTAIVTIFVRSSPIIQEDGRVSMDETDKGIMSNIDSIMRRGSWPSQGIRSITNFLYNLGSRNPDSLGFVRPPSPSRSSRLTMPPSARPAEAQRAELHRPWLASASSAAEGSESARSGHDAYVESPKTFDSPRSSRIRSESLYSKGPESPLRHCGFQRPPYRKFHCDKCNEYPDGFRNENDYRRHFEARHGSYRKAWYCAEPSNVPTDMPKPTNPISSCRVCQKRRFHSYQSAVVHLQRHHFAPPAYGRQLARGSNTEVVPEHLLKDWIRETRYVYEPGDVEDSDDMMENEAPTTDHRPPLAHPPLNTSLPSPTSLPRSQGPVSASHGSDSQRPIPPPRSHSHGYPFPPRQTPGEGPPQSAPHLPRYESPPSALPPPRQPQPPSQHLMSQHSAQQPSQEQHAGGIQLPPLNSAVPSFPPPTTLSHSSSYHSDSGYGSQPSHAHQVPPPPSPSPSPYSQHHPGHSHSHSAHYAQPPPPLQTQFNSQGSPSTPYPPQSHQPTPNDASQPRIVGPPPTQYQPQPIRPGVNMLQPPPGVMAPQEEPPYELSKTPENRSRCPFPDCGRVFKDITSHMLTHQEQRPEKCPIESCEYHTKGFARKYDKNRHALTHYKGTMICPFCSGSSTGFERTFNRADVFKRHLTSMHHVEQAPPNSRRPVGGASRTTSGNNNSTVNSEAQCSICHGRFTTAQEFYEHLDECVLNEIVPAAHSPKSGTPTGAAAAVAAVASASAAAASANTGSGSAPKEATVPRGSRDWSDTQSVHSQGSVKGKGKLKEKKVP
ncbi:hypothetical protein BROUX41_005519 [Berkeleyomyces rouxiae]